MQQHGVSIPLNWVIASYTSAKNTGSSSNHTTVMGDGSVFHYSNESSAPVFSLNITVPAQTYSTPDLLPPTVKPSLPPENASHILAYVLVPLGSLVVIAALSFLVSAPDMSNGDNKILINQ